MAKEITLDELVARRGSPVVGADGETIGTIGEVQYEVDTRKPLFLKVNRGGDGRDAVYVPVADATWSGESLEVPYAAEDLESAPRFDDDTELTGEPHRELDTFFGQLDHPLARERQATKDASMTIHEEELAVGKRPVAVGAVRIRKWVETEPVQLDVELRRETARVVREEVNEPVDGTEIGEAVIEVPLVAEQPVVQKQVVAKERVSVEKTIETERQTVEEEVRRERVEVEGDPEQIQ